MTREAAGWQAGCKDSEYSQVQYEKAKKGKRLYKQPGFGKMWVVAPLSAIQLSPPPPKVPN